MELNKYSTVKEIDTDLRSQGLEDPSQAVLVSNSQDVDAVLENLGLKREDGHDYGCMIVWVGDGEYNAVYGIWSSIPGMHCGCQRIR